MRCHNAQIERFTLATAICSRGNFFEEEILTLNILLIFIPE